jgi:hypothetical protein
MTDRKKCNRCKMNLKLSEFKIKRDDSYMKRCIECNAKCKKASEKCPSWKPVKCDQCGMVCSAASSLRDHVKAIHDKNRDHACDQCEYKSSKASDLQTHVKAIHDKIKDYLCDRCEFKSSHVSNLRRHVKICTGEETCSAGESKLRRILDEMKIEWTNGSHEIRNPLTGYLLRWDIIIWQFGEPIFIEYDGQQHFEVVTCWGGQAEFETTQARDKLKDDYCRDEGYLLLRIPFTQYENMEAIVVDFIRSHTCWD